MAKLALEDHLENFVDALQAASPGVSRLARTALHAHASIIGADRLRTIFAESSYPHVRRQTLSLISRLSRWQQIPLLIEIYGSQDPSTRTTADNFIRSWLSNYNRTHQVQPTKSEITQLWAAIETHQLLLRGELVSELSAIAKSFM